MASGDTLLLFSPLNAEILASEEVYLDFRNAHPILNFSDNIQEKVNFTAILPRHYSGNGFTVKVHFAMSSAISGNVLWKVAIERIGEVLDIDSDSFAGFEGMIKAVPGNSGEIAIAEISFADGSAMDNLVKGELFRLNILRHGTHASDTATGDAELLIIEMKET